MGSREFAALCRRHAYEALDVLVEIMRNGTSQTARIAAAEQVLDRGSGPSSIEVGVDMTDMFSAFDEPSHDEFKATCQALAPEAIDILRTIAAHGKSSAIRVRAARALLARGKGLAAQAATTPGGRSKKAEAASAAASAGDGTDWQDDLRPPDGFRRRDN
ncbi:MAG: hypothetical protein WCF64_09725 [Methylocella sp.]